MNLLISEAPTKIKVGDEICDIRYDYRTIIKTICALEDPILTNMEKEYILLNNIYKKIPKDKVEASRLACKFIDGGEEFNSKKSNSKRIYSFQKDGNYIFTGINSTHHIDLSTEKDLHWWKFLALFLDMDTECFFSELIYFRKRKIEGKLTKEEKKKYKEIQDLVEIDENKSIKFFNEKQQFLNELRGVSN